jgi:hypothetical protein
VASADDLEKPQVDPLPMTVTVVCWASLRRRRSFGLRNGKRSSVGGPLQASSDLSVRSFVSTCSGEEISISSYAHLSLRERSRCGSAESVEVNDGLSAGHHLPVGHVRKRLGKQRTEDDEVEGSDVCTDGVVSSSSA